MMYIEQMTLTERLRERLRAFLAAESTPLLHILRSYVVRMGVDGARAADTDVDTAAAELLNEVTVEALTHADRFDPARQPRAWLLGIAANLLRRQRAENGNRQRRELLALDLANDEYASDEEVFDQLAGISAAMGDPAE
ncbi:MAG: hypothetical protein KF726_01445 [Anaerolineae bacterium]|nr:hypothetical protein [Anaerolineae bacterium]